MAIAALTAGILAAPLMAAPVSERGLFNIPGAEDFRIQSVARSDREHGWPFVVDEGYLMCAWIMGRRSVYFSEKAGNGKEARIVMISTDPFDLAFVNIGANDLFAPFDGLEELIPMVAPFERLGLTLCDQPRGTAIGPGEL